LDRKLPHASRFADEEPGTRPSASSPFPLKSGKHVSVREVASTSSERRAVRSLPREEPEDLVAAFVAQEDEDDASRTPRPVSGGIALESVPRLVRRPQSLIGLEGLDHKAGFVLSLIDGESTVQTLIDVSGMAPLAVVTTLETLVNAGVVLIG
jgi:hypothetical protein